MLQNLSWFKKLCTVSKVLGCYNGDGNDKSALLWIRPRYVLTLGIGIPTGTQLIIRQKA